MALSGAYILFHKLRMSLDSTLLTRQALLPRPDAEQRECPLSAVPSRPAGHYCCHGGDLHSPAGQRGKQANLSAIAFSYSYIFHAAARISEQFLY